MTDVEGTILQSLVLPVKSPVDSDERPARFPRSEVINAIRHALAWKLCSTKEHDFCVVALEEALGRGRPEKFNTDQSLP